MSDRGMKKWNAYKSLPEHEPAINEAKKSKYKVIRPTISSEEAEIINDILVHYQGEMLSITYYREGHMFDINTEIKKINPELKRLELPDRSIILLSEIVMVKYYNKKKEP